MIFEQTIGAVVECSGVGLHSGAKATMRILPAPAGSGIVFRRVDLDGFCVEATGRNIAKVSYATSLMKKGVLISTTEHLLSAFMGAGVDNATVELDNLEVPLLDGSAQPFMEMLAAAGMRRQRRKRVYLRVKEPVEVRDGQKYIVVHPCHAYQVCYTIDFPHPLIGLSSYEVDLSDGAYRQEIAAARTFGFLRDERMLRHLGLIRGVSPANCVVLTDDAVANPPLRFPDEFVRHKVLDLIGDLALVGHRILGRVVAHFAGHAMHTALVARLLKDRSICEETTLESAREDELPGVSATR